MPITFNVLESVLDSVWYYDASAETFTERTGTTCDLFPNDAAVGDMIYFLIGDRRAQFSGVEIPVITALVADNIEGVWEYHKGYQNNWVWMPFDNVVDDTNDFQNVGTNNVTWDIPPSTDWNNYYLPAGIPGKYYQYHCRYRITALTNLTEGGACTRTSIQFRSYDIVITSGTEENPTTFTDIYDADVAEGWGVVIKNDRSFVINTNLHLKAGYYLSSKQEAISFGTNYQWLLYGIVKFGEIYSGDKVRYGSTFIFSVYNRSLYGTSWAVGQAGSEWLDTVVRCVKLGGAFHGFGQSAGDTASKVYDCYFEQYQGLTLGSGIIGVLGLKSNALILPSGAIVSGLITFGGQNGWRLTASGHYIHNCDFSKVTGCPFIITGYADRIWYAVDTNFGTYTYDKFAKWDGSSGPGNKIYIVSSVVVRIIDKEGEPIQGATVTLKDKDGIEVFSYITNADGYIGQDSGTITAISASSLTDDSKGWALNEWRFKEIYITSGDGMGQRRFIPQQTANPTVLPLVPDFEVIPAIGDRYIIVPYVNSVLIEPLVDNSPTTVWSKYTEYSPFTMEIKKDGYWLHKSKFDLTKKIEWIIALPPYDTDIPAQPTGLTVDTPPARPSGLSIENPDPAPARPSGLTIEEV